MKVDIDSHQGLYPDPFFHQALYIDYIFCCYSHHSYSHFRSREVSQQAEVPASGRWWSLDPVQLQTQLFSIPIYWL
jgi:hypothetical protein